MPSSVPAMKPPLARGASEPTRNGVGHSLTSPVLAQPEDLPALDVDPVERLLRAATHTGPSPSTAWTSATQRTANSAIIALCDSFAAEKKTVERACRPCVYTAMSRRHALGRRFHRGRLGHDQPPRLSHRLRSAHAATSSRTPRACCRSRTAAFPAAVAEIRERLGDHAAAAGRDGRLQPRLGRSALCPVPGGARRAGRASRLGRASARRSSPASRTLGDGRADVMRGEEVQLLGAVAAGTGRSRRAWSATRARTTNGSTLRGGRDRALPHGHDRRAVQPA